MAGSSDAWLRAMVERFFEYHLAVGPIIRMMQEEALRAGSPLAAQRQCAHEGMRQLLIERLEPRQQSRDPLVYQAPIWALEAASLDLLGRNASRDEIERAKAVLDDVLIASLCPAST